MASVDGSSGLIPGVLVPGGRDVITMPTCTRVEVLCDGPGRLHLAISPAGSDFTLFTPASQFIRPGESTEVTTTGTPTFVVKAEPSSGAVYQIRVLA
jgi:hypothetical protein